MTTPTIESIVGTGTSQSEVMRVRDNSVSSAGRVTGGDLGRTQFLQLLVAQMQYQDPLEPQKDTAFIAQLAQFNSLAQMEDLNKTMSAFQAYQLVGKAVHSDYMGEDYANHSVDGIVTEVYSKKDTMYASLTLADGRQVEVKTSTINKVYDTGLNTNNANSQAIADMTNAANLIGKQIEGAIPNLYKLVRDADGKPVLDEQGKFTFVYEQKPVYKLGTAGSLTQYYVDADGNRLSDEGYMLDSSGKAIDQIDHRVILSYTNDTSKPIEAGYLTETKTWTDGDGVTHSYLAYKLDAAGKRVYVQDAGTAAEKAAAEADLGVQFSGTVVRVARVEGVICVQLDGQYATKWIPLQDVHTVTGGTTTPPTTTTPTTTDTPNAATTPGTTGTPDATNSDGSTI